MTKTLATLLVLVIGLAAGPAGAALNPANPNVPIWQDEFGEQFDSYVEARPGDTVKVWHVINRNPDAFWQLDRVRSALWWDSAVIANIDSGDGSIYVTPDYTGSTVIDVYGASEDHSPPQWGHYTHVDMWGLILIHEIPESTYRVVGWNIPIRPDAPLGETTLGMQLAGTWVGYTMYNYKYYEYQPWALTINVVPEPATMSLLALGGLAILKRRRK